MKKILFIASILATTLSISQSFTISHQGLAPSSTLTVNAGEEIQFIYGSGGTHPMAEGWNSGEVSTPIAFVTQTVTSSNPTATFTLDTPGTYYFHCDTNPGNQDNWGKIIVLASGTSSVEEVALTEVSIYPNPATNMLNIKGLTNKAVFYNLVGEKVLETTNSVVNIETLPIGVYVINVDGVNHKFIKE